MAALFVPAGILLAAATGPELLTPFEESGGLDTPRYEETVSWCEDLAASSELLQFTSFGVSPQGRDLPLVAKRLFQHKGLMYLALLYPWGSEEPSGPGEQKVEVRLLERPYFYDMRAGEFKSRTEAFRTTLTPHEPRIYALLPYKVDEVVVEGRVTGRDLTYEVTLVRREAHSPAEDHTVRLELDGPDGRNRPSYTTLMMVPAGQLTAQTRIGLEEPAGEWTIRAVDVVTGLEAEATFTLEEAQ